MDNSSGTKKKRCGKIISNNFFKLGDYLSREYFEEAIKEEQKRLQAAWWLYPSMKVGEIQILRSKRGARVIAYDIFENS